MSKMFDFVLKGGNASQLEKDIGSDMFPANEHYFGLVNVSIQNWQYLIQALFFSIPFLSKWTFWLGEGAPILSKTLSKFKGFFSLKAKAIIDTPTPELAKYAKLTWNIFDCLWHFSRRRQKKHMS